MAHKTNVMTKLAILIFFALLGATTTVAGKVIYVDGGTSGANNGSSWTQL